MWYVVLGLQLSSAWAAPPPPEFVGPPLDRPYPSVLNEQLFPSLEQETEDEDISGEPETTAATQAREQKWADPRPIIRGLPKIRDQDRRGTCSVFSATAALEYFLIRDFKLPIDTDLSEEWLAYLALRESTSTKEASGTRENFDFFKAHGTPNEELLRYVGVTWKDTREDPAKSLCRGMTADTERRCLLAHRDPDLLSLTSEELNAEANSTHHDPDFAKAREQAYEHRDRYLQKLQGARLITSPKRTRELLRLGIPVLLDMQFFYGAWNHPFAEKIDVPRDRELWTKGIVGFPNTDSADRIRSPRYETAHSVLLVGYDDLKKLEIPRSRSRVDTYTGVFYFRNAWGTNSFGSGFTYEGESFPGYGVISQRYAFEFGHFYEIVWEE